jgi:non-heme chloroperoxidase
VAQLAADLADLLAALDLRGVVAVGHSMGCSVLWGLWDAHADAARAHLRGAVFIDQSPHMRVEEGWTAEQAREVGALFTAAQIDGLPEVFDAMAPGLVRSLYTDSVDADEFAWSMRHGDALCPADIAVVLLQDHAGRDWLNALGKVHVPSLVVTGELSVFSSNCDRYNHEHIPGSKFLLFGPEDKGSHFMFFENPDKFDQAVESFIKENL